MNVTVKIQKNLPNSSVSYHCLLGAYCKAGNIEKAIEILDMMDKDNLYINEGTFNMLVQCHLICRYIVILERVAAKTFS